VGGNDDLALSLVNDLSEKIHEVAETPRMNRLLRLLDEDQRARLGVDRVHCQRDEAKDTIGDMPGIELLAIRLLHPEPLRGGGWRRLDEDVLDLGQAPPDERFELLGALWLRSSPETEHRWQPVPVGTQAWFGHQLRVVPESGQGELDRARANERAISKCLS
jgi:hypothetical protein